MFIIELELKDELHTLIHSLQTKVNHCLDMTMRHFANGCLKGHKAFWQMESDKMTARLEGMSLSEERDIMEMMEMGDEMRDIDGDDDLPGDWYCLAKTS